MDRRLVYADCHKRHYNDGGKSRENAPPTVGAWRAALALPIRLGAQTAGEPNFIHLRHVAFVDFSQLLEAHRLLPDEPTDSAGGHPLEYRSKDRDEPGLRVRKVHE